MYHFTKDCLIGISEIDAEHEKLFSLIADTDAALKADKDSIEKAILLI